MITLLLELSTSRKTCIREVALYMRSLTQATIVEEANTVSIFEIYVIKC